MTVDHLMHSRRQQLHVSTRSEIVMSIIAAMFFVAVLAWRLPRAGFAPQPVGVVAAALWITITAFQFRKVIRSSGSAPDTASIGLAYYRRERQVRRDHLRNGWLWHGPLLVTLLLLLANLAGPSSPGMDRFRNAAPMFLLLLLWIVFGFPRRFRQAGDIQREIDDIARLEERS